MARTFGEEICRFSETVSVVNSSIQEEAWSAIANYLKDELAISFISFLRRCSVQQKVGLMSEKRWVFGGYRTNFMTIVNDDNQYSGQACYAYDRDEPIWIVDPCCNPLTQCETFQNLWPGENNEEIPQYRNKMEHAGNPACTSIIIPVRSKLGDIFGVINYESTEYIEYSKTIADELIHIAEAIGNFFLLFTIHENRRKHTIISIDKLTDSSRPKVLDISVNKIFIGWPYNSDHAVTNCIEAVLRDEKVEQNLNSSKRIKPIFWKDITTGGIINLRILEAMLSCKYGIFYLSEIDIENKDSGFIRYKDNKNVLIEAGILSGKLEGFNHWIPIRETEESNIERMPFDFANNRILYVPRRSNGELLEPKFKSDLIKYLTAIIHN